MVDALLWTIVCMVVVRHTTTRVEPETLRYGLIRLWQGMFGLVFYAETCPVCDAIVMIIHDSGLKLSWARLRSFSKLCHLQIDSDTTLSRLSCAAVLCLQSLDIAKVRILLHVTSTGPNGNNIKVLMNLQLFCRIVIFIWQSRCWCLSKFDGATIAISSVGNKCYSCQQSTCQWKLCCWRRKSCPGLKLWERVWSVWPEPGNDTNGSSLHPNFESYKPVVA